MATVWSVRYVCEKHYEEMTKKGCNTCNMAAWVINRNEECCNSNKGGLSLKTFINRLFNHGEESAPVAANVEEISANECTCEPTRCKILVVSKGNSFSDEVMNYAIDMAAKTKSGLVALNLDENGSDFGSFNTTSCGQAVAFAAKADAAGICFAHRVEQGQENEVVSMLYKEDDEFKYVMDDVCSKSSTKTAIPVYTRTMMRAE